MTSRRFGTARHLVGIRLLGDPVRPGWEPVLAVGLAVRTPSLKVRGKGFVRLRTEAAGLLASVDPASSTTPHYDGYGAVLVDLDRIDLAQLGELLEAEWRLTAPAALRSTRPG